MHTSVATYAPAMELAFAITRLRARLRTEQAAVTTGQTTAHLSVLGRIAEHGPITVSELAQAEHVRQRSITETVAGLRREGLIRGEPDPSDGRKRLLTVTARGRRLVDSIVECRSAWLARAIAGHMSKSEQETLAAATRTMSRLADCVLDPPADGQGS